MAGAVITQAAMVEATVAEVQVALFAEVAMLSAVQDLMEVWQNLNSLLFVNSKKRLLNFFTRFFLLFLN